MPKILSIESKEDGQLCVTFEPCASDGSVRLFTEGELFRLRMELINHGKQEERERLNNLEREKETYAEILAELKVARKLLWKSRQAAIDASDELIHYFDTVSDWDLEEVD
jgi:hypothetical protein